VRPAEPSGQPGLAGRNNFNLQTVS
jgi:hypothetical protein